MSETVFTRNVGPTLALFLLLSLMIGTISPASAQIKQLREKPNAELETLCADGTADACTILGYSYMIGDRGLPKDLARAEPYSKRACDLGGKLPCSDYAAMVADRVGSPALFSDPDGVEYSARACERGFDEFCEVAAYMSIANRVAGMQIKDVTRRKDLISRACHAGKGYYCYIRGSMAWTRDRDLEAARNWYEKGCAFGYQDVCMTGTIEEINFKIRSEICDRGHAYSCDVLAYESWKDWKSLDFAIRLADKACALGSENGCRNLAVFRKEQLVADARQFISSNGGAENAIRALIDTTTRQDLLGTVIWLGGRNSLDGLTDAEIASLDRRTWGRDFSTASIYIDQQKYNRDPRNHPKPQDPISSTSGTSYTGTPSSPEIVVKECYWVEGSMGFPGYAQCS